LQKISSTKLKLMLTTRAARSIQSTFRFCYILRNYRKAYCTPSTTSASTARQTLFTHATRSIARYLLWKDGWLAGWLAGCHTPVSKRLNQSHLKTFSTVW